MGYLEIVDLTFKILSCVLSLLFLHFIFFSIVGLFGHKKFPKTEEKLKYGIIIPARNEEKVVADLINSIKSNKYPQEKLHIFVIAHNCTDRTAEIARENGATVYEYNNSNECTMGYAFKYLFSRIKSDYGTENYDGFFLFNADNVLANNYFEKMNDAFVANGKKEVITSFRNSKNFGDNIMSAMYGIYFMMGCRFESRGRTICGCSTRVQGTGYVIPSDIVKDGWKYVTLTEDWEFSADQILNNRKIVYCDEAVFYDEQPTKTKIMLRQRLRWAKGHLLVCLSRYFDIIKSILKPKRFNGGKHKFSLFDISENILPICIVYFLVFLANVICVAIAPLIVLNCDIQKTWIDFAIGFGASAALFYLLNFIGGTTILIAEHKRIVNLKFGVALGALLFWPIFLFMSIPLELLCIFMKVGWKPIPHTASLSNFNETKQLSEICLSNVVAKSENNENTDNGDNDTTNS